MVVVRSGQIVSFCLKSRAERISGCIYDVECEKGLEDRDNYKACGINKGKNWVTQNGGVDNRV